MSGGMVCFLITSMSDYEWQDKEEGGWLGVEWSCIFDENVGTYGRVLKKRCIMDGAES